ncbi:phosphoribosyltransferase [Marinobacter caseinilyticus]|uniref:phosphoribosyltransferase n=1 Tax=Marinobacter caseinilyticus TaxID=2692195 RepID=UPI00140ACB93|nr:phosphoribosyltransferase [Marinobacter caseinilyticus]
MRFRNRSDAGHQLAGKLSRYRDETDLLVIGLPRGGVPVAAEIANALGGELDVLLVRKLGLPWHRELAAGAIASGGARILNSDVIESSGLSVSQLQSVIESEQNELERRERLFRGNRPGLRVAGRHVIVVDDGLATGATMTAALTALRSLGPKRITAAIPVASTEALERIAAVSDETVCLYIPANLYAVGQWYEDFDQVEDEEVQRLLAADQKGPDHAA